ncbi:hypothetical protein Taro_016407 [Colocasia esculenta]|uniref:Uncharacterized protein n=1 Tax=Colocasia esculenta TaxID=4460 RepID=A0A843UNF3_COLES|nr:hypothetical protein [Colocasia esculenta]
MELFKMVVQMNFKLRLDSSCPEPPNSVFSVFGRHFCKQEVYENLIATKFLSQRQFIVSLTHPDGKPVAVKFIWFYRTKELVQDEEEEEKKKRTQPIGAELSVALALATTAAQTTAQAIAPSLFLAAAADALALALLEQFVADLVLLAVVELVDALLDGWMKVQMADECPVGTLTKRSFLRSTNTGVTRLAWNGSRRRPT